MKRKIILTIAILFYFVPVIFSQHNYLISAGLGIIQSYGTAEGFEIGIRRAVNDNLRFQLTIGYYNWGKKIDINAMAHYPLNQNTHIKREMNSLIPLRAGFNFKFGNSNSHPYLAIEWIVNYMTNDFYTQDPIADGVISYVRTYSKITEDTIFISLGFNLGYTFYLSDDLNIISGVNWQSGKSTQFVGFMSGIEYKL
ncbi:hypothetical protein C0389_02185 [bacterium]|nr:hypothetical protein [bacterium]